MLFVGFARRLRLFEVCKEADFKSPEVSASFL
jgi:hypothetical protein